MNDKNTTQSSKHPFVFSVAKVPETETKDSMLELMRTMVAEFVAIGSLQCFAGVSRETELSLGGDENFLNLIGC